MLALCAYDDVRRFHVSVSVSDHEYDYANDGAQ
jgi:hypothetical protein